MLGPQPRPCGSCPYRQDVPSGVWHPEEYEKLPPFDLPTGEQPMAMFGCHQQDGHLCAGWCGTHDMQNNLGLRLGERMGHIAPEEVDKALDYVSPVPLWSSGTEAAEHGMAEVDAPGDKADRTIRRLKKKLDR